MQEIRVSLGQGRTRSQHNIVVVYGIHDSLTAVEGSPEATFCNQPWEKLFARGIKREDLWRPGEVRMFTRDGENTHKNPTPQKQTLLHARLFMVAHVSVEVGAQTALWLLSQQYDQERLDVWRFSWRVSLDEIMWHVDCQKELSNSRDIAFQLQRQKMVTVLRENRHKSFLPFLQHAQIEKRQQTVLETLDQGKSKDKAQ